MIPESSLPCAQDTAKCYYPQPDSSGPRLPINIHTCNIIQSLHTISTAQNQELGNNFFYVDCELFIISCMILLICVG
jgi:hypothetical protein